jgi:hypothetical protein
MKKPVSQWAVAMWIISATIAASYLLQLFPNLQSGAGFAAVLDTVHYALWPVASIAGLGALIELVDQIRCDAKHRA